MKTILSAFPAPHYFSKKDLNNKLFNLYENEEFTEEDFSREISEKVDEIKKYLDSLEEQTLKLQDSFSKLGKDEKN